MKVQNDKIQNILNSRGANIKAAPKYIQEIVEKLERAKNRDEMFEVLDNAVKKTADFICLDDVEFVGNGYKFQCTLKNYTKNLSKNNANLPSGWDFVRVIPIGESSSSVILTKVSANA